MANLKATKKVVETITGYTLELTVEEAEYLAALLWCGVVGGGTCRPNPLAEVIYALGDVKRHNYSHKVKPADKAGRYTEVTR